MFKFNEQEYEYIDMVPNQTRLNERRVELPLAMEFLDWFEDQEILEVGNVTYHYTEIHHDVLDLNEKVRNYPIINEDILTWEPKRDYDAILSISTLEHTNDPLKAVKKILNMADHVLITIPLGYLKTDEIFDSGIKMNFLKRVSKDNEWVQAERSEVIDAKYNQPFPFANAIMVIKT